MEKNLESSYIVATEQQRVVRECIENDDFEKAIKVLNIYNEEEIKKLFLDRNEIKELQGAAYYTLANILAQDYKLTPKEAKIQQTFKIETDIEKAKICYRKSLKCGYGDSANKLFQIYYKENNFAKAHQIAEIGVDLGDVKSYYNMGKLFYEGKGTKQNYRQARQFFEVSFNENGRYGGYQLGIMYELGLDVSVNQSKALEYFYGAAECGDALACFKMGGILSGFYDGKYTCIKKNPQAAIEYYTFYLTHCNASKRTNALRSIAMIEAKSKNVKDRNNGQRKLLRLAKRGDQPSNDALAEQTPYGKLEKESRPVDLSFLNV